MMADRMHLRSEIHRLVIWPESGSASKSSLFFSFKPVRFIQWPIKKAEVKVPRQVFRSLSFTARSMLRILPLWGFEELSKKRTRAASSSVRSEVWSPWGSDDFNFYPAKDLTFKLIVQTASEGGYLKWCAFGRENPLPQSRKQVFKQSQVKGSSRILSNFSNPQDFCFKLLHQPSSDGNLIAIHVTWLKRVFP